MRKRKRKQTKRRLWKANSLQCLSSEYDIRIGLHEEESLETLAQCRQWLSWRSLLRKQIPDAGTSDGERPATDSWESDRWHKKATGVGRAQCPPARSVTDQCKRSQISRRSSMKYFVRQHGDLIFDPWGTRSQWRVTSASVMWSADRIWYISSAAAFCTDCRRRTIAGLVGRLVRRFRNPIGTSPNFGWNRGGWLVSAENL